MIEYNYMDWKTWSDKPYNNGTTFSGYGDQFGAIYPQQGWQCPVCLKVYSPSMSMCITDHVNMTTVTTTSTDAKKEKD